MIEAAARLREHAKDFDLAAESLRERETPEAEISAAINFAAAIVLTQVADALEEEAA